MTCCSLLVAAAPRFILPSESDVLVAVDKVHGHELSSSLLLLRPEVRGYLDSTCLDVRMATGGCMSQTLP